MIVPGMLDVMDHEDGGTASTILYAGAVCGDPLSQWVKCMLPTPRGVLFYSDAIYAPVFSSERFTLCSYPEP